MATTRTSRNAPAKSPARKAAPKKPAAHPDERRVRDEPKRYGVKTTIHQDQGKPTNSAVAFAKREANRRKKQ